MVEAPALRWSVAQDTREGAHDREALLLLHFCIWFLSENVHFSLCWLNWPLTTKVSSQPQYP